MRKTFRWLILSIMASLFSVLFATAAWANPNEDEARCILNSHGAEQVQGLFNASDDVLAVIARTRGVTLDSSCDHNQKARIIQAVLSAQETAQSCLQRLNPAIARRFMNRFRGPHPVGFACVAGQSGSGGHTIPGGNTIFLNQSGNSGGVSHYGLDARAFHEMLHLIDTQLPHMCPANHLHNQNNGYPDPVYSCQLACFPEGMTLNDTPNRVRSVGAVEPLTDFPCTGAEPTLCVYQQKYARICQTGRFPLTEQNRAKIRVGTEFVTCIMNHATCRTPACRQWVAQIDGRRLDSDIARAPHQAAQLRAAYNTRVFNLQMSIRNAMSNMPDSTETGAVARDLTNQANQNACFHQMGF
jgi:hypothetical protein